MDTHPVVNFVREHPKILIGALVAIMIVVIFIVIYFGGYRMPFISGGKKGLEGTVDGLIDSIGRKQKGAIEAAATQ